MLPSVHDKPSDTTINRSISGEKKLYSFFGSNPNRYPKFHIDGSTYLERLPADWFRLFQERRILLRSLMWRVYGVKPVICMARRRRIVVWIARWPPRSASNYKYIQSFWMILLLSPAGRRTYTPTAYLQKPQVLLWWFDFGTPPRRFHYSYPTTFQHVHADMLVT